MRTKTKRIAALFIGSLLAACDSPVLSGDGQQVAMSEEVELSDPMADIPIDESIRVRFSDVAETTPCDTPESCD